MDAPVEILILASDADLHRQVEGLARGLQSIDCVVDICTDIASAQGLFLQRGGHVLLVICPKVSPGMASRALENLRAVDDALPVAVFGDSLRNLEGLEGVHGIRSFAPDSRAGLGAIQKMLCALR